MAAIREMMRQASADGFLDENAEAKVPNQSNPLKMFIHINQLSVHSRL